MALGINMRVLKKNRFFFCVCACKVECWCHFAQGLSIVSCIFYHHVFFSNVKITQSSHRCVSTFLLVKQPEKKSRGEKLTSLSVCDIYPLVNNFPARRVSSRNEKDSKGTLAPGKYLGRCVTTELFCTSKRFGFYNFHQLSWQFVTHCIARVC